jgi:hypothetical protein
MRVPANAHYLNGALGALGIEYQAASQRIRGAE